MPRKRMPMSVPVFGANAQPRLNATAVSIPMCSTCLSISPHSPRAENVSARTHPGAPVELGERREHERAEREREQVDAERHAEHGPAPDREVRGDGRQRGRHDRARELPDDGVQRHLRAAAPASALRQRGEGGAYDRDHGPFCAGRPIVGVPRVVVPVVLRRWAGVEAKSWKWLRTSSALTTVFDSSPVVFS